MSVTFLHTADWQLGKAFASVEDPQKRVLLQQERLNVLDRIAAVAQTRGAAFIVVAGDLFDSTRPTQSTVSAACSAIGRMSVPVFAIPGNHDHAGPGGVWEQPYFQRERESLAPNLEILTAPAPVTRAGAVLLPCPLLRRHHAVDGTAWLRGADSGPAEIGDLPRIVLAHGSVQDFGQQADDDNDAGESINLIDLSRLDTGRHDYLALGDWHGTRQVSPHGWYAGTPELDRFPKGDQQPGGVLLVTAARGRPPEVERVSTARFRWHELTFTLSDDSTLPELERRLAELVGPRVGEDLVRLELAGTLGIEASARLGQLLDAWRARLLRLRLTDRTRIAPSSEELAALVGRVSDPLIARVASALMTQSAGNGEDGAVARLALRELHAACR